jgi:hypothetical protein
MKSKTMVYEATVHSSKWRRYQTVRVYPATPMTLCGGCKKDIPAGEYYTMPSVEADGPREVRCRECRPFWLLRRRV